MINDRAESFHKARVRESANMIHPLGSGAYVDLGHLKFHSIMYCMSCPTVFTGRMV